MELFYDSLAYINQIFLRILQTKAECFCNHFSLAMFSSQKESRFYYTKIRKTDKKKPTKQSRKPNQNLFQCFWNHFSLAMFSSQKESRYENQENRPKKNQQNNQENQTKICFSVFEIIFLWPCLVVRKNQDTKIRKTDQKKTNKTIKKTKPKFVSVFFFFCSFFFYFLNPFITSFSFFPASVVNKSTCKFI